MRRSAIAMVAGADAIDPQCFTGRKAQVLEQWERLWSVAFAGRSGPDWNRRQSALSIAKARSL
jgi:hypothetical protein